MSSFSKIPPHTTTRPLNIAIMSDFFYPNLGGVEMHMYFLAYCLIERGHKVIIISKTYGDRQSIRYLPNGIKCYYVPFGDWWIRKLIYPSLLLGVYLPLTRNILLRESIEVLHCHQSSSMLV